MELRPHVYCDRCGKQHELLHEGSTVIIIDGSRIRQLQLCEKCIEGIEDFIQMKRDERELSCAPGQQSWQDIIRQKGYAEFKKELHAAIENVANTCVKVALEGREKEWN